VASSLAISSPQNSGGNVDVFCEAEARPRKEVVIGEALSASSIARDGQSSKQMSS
jgi:hypothetical protein